MRSNDINIIRFNDRDKKKIIFSFIILLMIIFSEMVSGQNEIILNTDSSKMLSASNYAILSDTSKTDSSSSIVLGNPLYTLSVTVSVPIISLGTA